MDRNEVVLAQAINLTLEIYVDMRRRTPEKVDAARSELQRCMTKWIAEGVVDRERLAVMGLTHLRSLEHRPRMRNYRRPAKQQASAEQLTS